MADEFLAVTDGEYIITETDNPNQFLFYRDDEGELNVEHEPIDLFRDLIVHKFMNNEIQYEECFLGILE